jgi:prepilin-type N-terminal cleavage/methylation domain-containing protein
MKTRQFGFTLWELLMTLLVAGILLGIGVPNVMEFQRNGAMSATANDMVTAVLMARSEAVKRQAPTGFCLSANPVDVNPTCSPNPVADASDRGFVVWVDENNNVDANGNRILTDATDGNGVIDAGAGELVLWQRPATPLPLRVSANCSYVSFAPTGNTRPAGALCFIPAGGFRAILLCDDRGRRVAAGSLSSARIVRIDGPGRSVVLQETNEVNNWITTLIGAGLAVTCP